MKFVSRLPVRIFCAAVLAGALSGCVVNSQVKEPQFDAGMSAAAQAPAFIDARNAKNNKNIGRIAITSCNVLIGEMTSASASTGVGAFAPSSERSGRVDSKVRSMFYLRGVDAAQLQGLTEELCAQAEQTLRASGREVIPASELASNEHFIKMHEAGKESPFDFTPPGTKTMYKIFVPKGQKVFNPAYVGTGKGLSMALAAASSNSPDMHEGRLIDAYKADAAHIDILVDFASVESSSEGLSRFASSSTASVKGDVKLAVRGQIKFVSNETMDCWERFGKRECMSKGKNPEFIQKRALVADEKFVTEIKDETTTGDKVGGAVTSAIGMLSAMSGGSGMSTTTKRTGVFVDAHQYTTLVKKSFGHFLDMTVESVK